MPIYIQCEKCKSILRKDHLVRRLSLGLSVTLHKTTPSAPAALSEGVTKCPRTNTAKTATSNTIRFVPSRVALPNAAF